MSQESFRNSFKPETIEMTVKKKLWVEMLTDRKILYEKVKKLNDRFYDKIGNTVTSSSEIYIFFNLAYSGVVEAYESNKIEK